MKHLREYWLVYLLVLIALGSMFFLELFDKPVVYEDLGIITKLTILEEPSFWENLAHARFLVEVDSNHEYEVVVDCEGRCFIEVGFHLCRDPEYRNGFLFAKNSSCN